MKLLIHELSQLASITVRTLHYYDQIGLLVPNEVGSNGYRYYNEENLEKLKLILYYKELDFSLSQIRVLLEHSSNRRELLKQQQRLLQLKRDRLQKMLISIEKALKGENIMDFSEFDITEIQEAERAFSKEVEDRWGKSAPYEESKRRTGKYSVEDWKRIKQEENEIIQSFSSISHLDPSSVESQELVKRWQDHISLNFYECTNEILKGLGQMYIQDERFSATMDRYKEGTAHFISRAIENYVAS